MVVRKGGGGGGHIENSGVPGRARIRPDGVHLYAFPRTPFQSMLRIMNLSIVNIVIIGHGPSTLTYSRSLGVLHFCIEYERWWVVNGDDCAAVVFG